MIYYSYHIKSNKNDIFFFSYDFLLNSHFLTEESTKKVLRVVKY